MSFSYKCRVDPRSGKVFKITDKYFHQADLMLIYHPRIPKKSGWYRLISKIVNGQRTQLVVLEKPLHLMYNENDSQILKTRQTKGLSVCSKEHVFNSDYIRLATCTDVTCCKFSSNGYSVDKEIIKEMYYTNDGYAVLNALAEFQGNDFTVPTDISERALNIIKELLGGQEQ